MAKVLAISSQVVFGPVGNSAAVPALHSMGHEVLQVPTVLLSHHPGHGKPEGQATSPELFEKLLAGVQRVGGLDNCDAVMTGYFANAAQVEIAAKVIAQIRPRMILVDPVIGDDGKLYVAVETANAIRTQLVSVATITTPNSFELGWLTSMPVTARADAVAAVKKLSVAEVIVTSVHTAKNIETVLVTSDIEQTHTSAQRDDVPNGTGDFLSGLYLAHRLSQPPAPAFNSAMQILDKAISLSAGSPVLAITQALQK